MSGRIMACTNGDWGDLWGFTHRCAAWMFAIMCAAMLPLASGCDRDPNWQEPGPEAVFEQFLMAWNQDQRETAYEMIDPEDRKLLERPLDQLRQSAPEGAAPGRAEMLVTGRVDHPFDIEDIKVDEMPRGDISAGHRVTLNLTYFDERSGKATLVWRDGRWYIDLPVEEVAANRQTGTSKQQAGTPDE